MFNKEIEFSAHEDYFALKEDYPTPVKLNIPEWYKKLEDTRKNRYGDVGWDENFSHWKRIYEQSGKEGLKKFMKFEDKLKFKQISDILERHENGEEPLDPTLN